MHCEQCGARCQQVHDTTVRRVRDLPLFVYRVVLHVPRRRVECERCGGPRLEKLDCLGRNQRVSQRIADACEKPLRSTSVQAVAAFFDLSWHTVKSIDKTRLQASVVEPDWSAICYLAMDEFALHKGHRYATMVFDPMSWRVLWIGPGRSRETVRAFFEQLPAGVAQHRNRRHRHDHGLQTGDQRAMPPGRGGLRLVPCRGQVWAGGDRPCSGGSGQPVAP